MIEQIFLDLDGVLADWVGGVCRIRGLNQAGLEATWGPAWDICETIGCTPQELWREIDQAGQRFWAELLPYSWTRRIYDLCCSFAPTTILTSPSRHPSSLAGKLQWMNRHLGHGNAFRNFLIGPAKASCARRGAILIDDRDQNVREFEARGGGGIVFPRPWNSRRHVMGGEVAFVHRALKVRSR